LGNTGTLIGESVITLLNQKNTARKHECFRSVLILTISVKEVLMKKRKGTVLVVFLLLVSLCVWAGGGKETQKAAPPGGPQPKAVAQDTGPIDYPISGLGWDVKTNVKAKKKYVLGCVVKNSTNPYMIGQMKGFEEAGKAMGFDAIALAPAKQDSIEEQVRIMEDFIQRGVHGIAVHPSDSNGIVPVIEKAFAKNIPVIVMGTGANTTKKLAHVGTDYYQTGVIIATWVAEKLGGKGNIVSLSGPPQAENAHARQKGVEDGLKKFPGMKLLAVQPANFRRTDGNQVMENLIPKFGEQIDGVIGANDETAMGALMALESSGLSKKKDIIVGGFDCNKDGSYAIRDGRMHVSYNADPPSTAWLAAAYLVMYLDDGKLPPPRYVPYPNPEEKDAVVTKENVQYYIDKLAWWQQR
jgi:ABC-type sugar transport system substrate-binding protein